MPTPPSHQPASTASTTTNRTLPTADVQPSVHHTTLRLLLLYLLFVTTLSVYSLIEDRQKTFPELLPPWLIVNLSLTFIRTVARVSLRIYPPPETYPFLRHSLVFFLRLLTALSLSCQIVGIIFLAKTHEKSIRHTSTFYVISFLIALELFIFTLSIILTLAIFFFALRPILNPPRAATKDDISRLRAFVYNPPHTPEINPPSCTICLADYLPTEVLRELACKDGAHTFHAQCVDQWLLTRRTCPICRADPLAQPNTPSESTNV